MSKKTPAKYINEPLPHILKVNTDDTFARHDKNIANNVSDFFVFESRSKLCMNLSLYFHYIYQRTNPNIFGFFDFDINHFCDLFSWTDNLQRVVDNPDELYITTHRDSIYRAFDIESEDDKIINERMVTNIERFAKTKIGDAFIRLTFQDIIYSHKSFYGEQQDSKNALYSGKKITYIDEFIADYRVIKGKATRLSVQYKPNQRTILNNVKNFAYTNLELLGKLRKTDNLDFFHLYLSFALNTIKTSGKFENTWSMPRSLCARLLCLNPEREVKEINKAIRRKLQKYKGLSPEPFNFSLPVSAFVVLIEWPELKPVTKEQKRIAMNYAFRRYFEHEMYETYVKHHYNNEDAPMTFKQWLADSSFDIEAKKFAYVSAQRVIFKNKSISINDVSEKECLMIGVSPELKKIYPHAIA